MGDPVEDVIAAALDGAGIDYRRDDPLDFECDGFSIECKRLYSDRIANQIRDRENVIVVQGLGAATVLAAWIGDSVFDGGG